MGVPVKDCFARGDTLQISTISLHCRKLQILWTIVWWELHYRHYYYHA